jgi:hypothetical protein
MPNQLILPLGLLACLAAANPASAANPANAANAADATHVADAAKRSDAWELMSIRLGMSEADVMQAMPNATCEKFADGTTSLCFDRDRKLAGEPAKLMVKLLDAQVVYVGVENISIKQGLAGVAALSIKYGAPDRTFNTRADLHGADNDCGSCLYPVSSWLEGNIELFLNVSDWYSSKKDYTYSAIILQDTPVHNGRWVPRYNNKPAATEL